LFLARATAAADGRAAAEPLYIDLLAVPDAVVDEYGVPIAFHAAARLQEWHAAVPSVTRLLRAAVERPVWRSPTAFYQLRDLWVANGGDPAALEDQRLELESADAVQNEYERIGNIRPTQNGTGAIDPLWVSVGPGDWLVRVVGTGGETRAIVAVSAAAIADRLRATEVTRDSMLGSLQIALPGAGSGSPLGIARPDLTATFAEPPEAVIGRTMGLPNAFLVAALVLVLSITLFGGYLLLNDVKRETRLAEMRSDFVSSVSHELKTPLTAIRMFAETLRYGSNSDPAVTSDYLDTIVGESERLTRLLNNVLDLSKIEQGQKVYTREPTSLAQITERAARAVAYPLSTEGFDLHVDLDEALPAVRVDSDSVEQAVLNLLTNAMKYSGTARDIDLSLQRKNGHAVIAVRDRGIGIPEEDQPHLTEKFYRVRSPENASVPGTGLGLTLVEHTARAHGGFITVESVPGEGSTFSIHFPMEVEP
jgi:signal transduction histidine kinase